MKNEIKYVAESILKDAAGRGVLNAIVLVSWNDLNDSQLRYVFYLLSENYPEEKVMQLALLNLGMVRNSAGRYVSLSLYSRFISAESLAAEAKKMEYLTHIFFIRYSFHSGLDFFCFSPFNKVFASLTACLIFASRD